MTQFVALRVARAALMVVVLVIVTFALTHTFADPARMVTGPEASQEQYQAMKHFLGTDRSLPAQIASYLQGMIHGDFGVSSWQRVPAFNLALSRLPATLELAVTALALGLVVGVPLGLLGVTGRNRLVNGIANAVPVVLVSLADFWVGILLILLFAVNLGWLPTSGYGSIENLILPAFTLSLRPIGRTATMVREAVREEISKTYVTALKAKGLTEAQVIRRHVVKNVAPTFVTMLGYEFILVFTGYAVLVETVFQWPGLGRLAADAVLNNDIVLISAIVILAGILVAVVNIVVDVIHYLVDRRIGLKA